MNTFLQKITPKFLGRIDRYLLLNSPLVWGFKLHYLALSAIAVFLINVLLAYFWPINFANIPNRDLVKYGCYYTAGFYLVVVFTMQKSIQFVSQHGLPGRFHYIKVILIINVIVWVIFICYYYPFTLFAQRVEDNFINRQFSSRTFPFYIGSDTATIPPYDSGSSRISQQVTNYMVKKRGNLSARQIGWLAAYNSLYNSRNTSYQEDSMAGILDCHGYRFDTKSTLRIFYNQIVDSGFKIAPYNTEIICKKIPVSGDSAYPFLYVYVYKLPFADEYRYLEKNNLGEYLVGDRIKLEVLKRYPEADSLQQISIINAELSNLESYTNLELLEGLDTILALAAAYLVVMIIFFLQLFGVIRGIMGLISGAVLLVAGNFISSYAGLSSIRPRYKEGLIWIVVLLIIGLIVWKVSKKRKRKNWHIVLVQSLVYFCPFAIYYVSDALGDTLKESAKSDSITEIFSILLFLVLYPWFFITKLNRIYNLPRN
jgi:hypothetical protein